MLIRVMSAVILMFAASAAFAQEREWTFDTNDEDAFLTFGVPETDDVGVSFWCKMQSGEARVFLPEAGEDVKPGLKVKITFSVAGSKFTFDAETTRNEDAGNTSAEAAFPIDGEFFSALKAADRFAVYIGKDESVFPLEGADIDSFVRTCSTG
jgi:hypothetical protein